VLGGKLGYVRHPALIRSRRREVPGQEIGVFVGGLPDAGIGPFPANPGQKTLPVHDPKHRFVVDRKAGFSPQPDGDPAIPVSEPGGLLAGLDQAGDAPVVIYRSGPGTLKPTVVAAS
jgi:hypothetical protein